MSPSRPSAPWTDTPQGHSLLQALSRLERSVPGAQPLGLAPPRAEAVRLHGHFGLGFAPTEVLSLVDLTRVQAERDTPPGQEALDPGCTARRAAERAARHDARRDGPRWALLTPLLALAGPDGPLPLTDSERLAGRRVGLGAAAALPQGPGQALLDVFQHRWIALFYRGRQQHSPGLQWGRPGASPLGQLLDALSGLGLSDPAHGHGPAGEAPWLRHAGLLGWAPRSLDGLATLLADRLRLPVRGRPFVGGWLPVAAGDQARLGRSRLGGHPDGGLALLGRRAWDASAAVGLQIDPVPADRWSGLLPGGPDHARTAWLLRRHASSPLQATLTLQAARPEDARARLGRCRLGWSSWLRPGAQACTEGRRPAPVHVRLRPAAPAAAD